MEIQIFKNEEFGQIRTMRLTDGQIAFVGKDVAEVLGYSQADKAITRHVAEDDRMKCTVTDSIGRKQQSYFVNESGLYALILGSKLPKARRFKHWVTSEVLPQIRKTGGYIPVQKEDDENTILVKAVNILMKTVELQKQELASRDMEIVRLAPMAQYAEDVLLSPTCYTMTQVAKSLSMTVQELQHMLVKQHVIYRSPSGCWMLYADHLKKGYEAHRTKDGRDIHDQVIGTYTYLVWTERGKEFIHRLAA
ncbi:MAG: phage antirepressor KilAC domain-containing protein [Bacteroidales bacterium]|nr:phage antirepressor KilAC domain-containing protein [Candidatus Minthousia equi]